jgi:cytoskeletal protein CcmA (bactofilin family)
MFNAKKLDNNALNDREIRAFLEEGCEFEGQLTFSGVVRLNGKFRGTIDSDDILIVGDTAQVEGRLRVGSIIVGGRVSGEIYSKHRVEILATGLVEGLIEAPILIAHEGAVLTAQLKIQRTSA